MIRKEMVFIGENLTSRESVIRFIAHAAKGNGFVSDEQAFANAVFERERQVATSVGHFIAIPHGKCDAVKEPFVAYVRVREAFEWDEETKDLVQSIFLIGVPQSDTGKTHLRYISQVSKKLINDEFREALFACETAQEAFEKLDSINEGIRSEQ